MFNHLSDAHEAAVDLLAAVLDEDAAAALRRPSRRQPGSAPTPSRKPASPRASTWSRTASSACATATWRNGSTCMPDGTARSASGNVQLRPAHDGLWMDRPHENQTSRLTPCTGAPTQDIAGRYRCDELDAELTITDAGGVLYGGFSGFLGQSRMELLDPIGADLWALPCPRALDHTPPGDWTLSIQRDATTHPTTIEVGCWLARRLPYVRMRSVRQARPRGAAPWTPARGRAPGPHPVLL